MKRNIIIVIFSLLIILLFISTSFADSISDGKNLHSEIIERYPSLGKEYKEPFVSGGLTSNPICLISFPTKEWNKLSKSQKQSLFDYAKSLISVVKKNPNKYSGVSPNAPIAQRVANNILNMPDSAWGIDVGDFTNGGRDLLSGNIIDSL